MTRQPERLRDVVVESVNARDPELVEELDVTSTGALKDALQNLQERWPRLMMTRGDLDGTPVGVVWMPDRNEAYQPVAHVVPRSDDTATPLALVDGIDERLTVEEPAGRLVAEWESADAVDRAGGRWV
ncbi:MAG: hypothetical protein DWQ40_03575 [Actinobacteria bacterium]|nr:MAG: hypothetical protein DWQ40_03575 [Actinomycetota bacterium]REK38782.1 MAG: hypothetical protein DWQ20_03365 [Actinomycetota bacterium]